MARDHNLNLQQYLDWREKQKEKTLLKDISLSFDWSDINHILVENTADKLRLHKILNSLPKLKYLQRKKKTSINKIKLFG